MKYLIYLFIVAQTFTAFGQNQPIKRIGIIGLDTSHSNTFASMFNGEKAVPEFADFSVTIAYPWGSKTIEEGYSRVPKFTEQAKALGIKIANSIDELLQEVDFVLLETHDGRLHVEQALAIFKSGKPVFIDKPMAASLADICLLYELSDLYKTPTFSTSSFRYIAPVLTVVSGKRGPVLGADCFGPCKEESTHPSLYWYGMHTVEMLFTVMGTGCKTVSRTHTDETDVAVGVWNDSRIGVFRGMRTGGNEHYYHFGGFAYCEKGAVPLNEYSDYGYPGLMNQIVRFFRTGEIPVDRETTIEVYAFMDASALSLKTGKPVEIKDVIQKAKKTAKKELKKYTVAK